MGSHTCRLRGVIELNENVTEAQVKEVFDEFLASCGKRDYDNAIAEGAIEMDGSTLSLNVEFYGYGGYQNDDVDTLTGKLGQFVGADGEWLEVDDDDTGDSEARCVPQFFGPDELAAKRAQLRYACDQFMEWAGPVVGHGAAEELCKHARATLPIVMDKPAAPKG